MSIFVSLRHDLRRQHKELKQLLFKLFVFGALFIVLDRTFDAILLQGLKRYYGLNTSAEILLVGHSHTVLGIDKPKLESLTGRSVAKYALEGADVSSRQCMIRHFFSEQSDSVRLVVYSVDAHLFSGEALGANLQRIFYPFMDTPAVNSYIRNETADVVDYYTRYLIQTTRYSETTLAFSARGWLGLWTNLKRGVLDREQLEKRIASGDYRRIAFNPEKIRIFEETLSEIRSRGIPIVLLFIPTVDLVNAIEPDQFSKAIERFMHYAQRDPGIYYLDYNSEFSGNRALFFDPIHLNPEGQRQVTARLAKDLNELFETFSHRSVNER